MKINRLTDNRDFLPPTDFNVPCLPPYSIFCRLLFTKICYFSQGKCLRYNNTENENISKRGHTIRRSIFRSLLLLLDYKLGIYNSCQCLSRNKCHVLFLFCCYISISPVTGLTYIAASSSQLFDVLVRNILNITNWPYIILEYDNDIWNNLILICCDDNEIYLSIYKYETHFVVENKSKGN